MFGYVVSVSYEKEVSSNKIMEEADGRYWCTILLVVVIPRPLVEECSIAALSSSNGVTCTNSTTTTGSDAATTMPTIITTRGWKYCGKACI